MLVYYSLPKGSTQEGYLVCAQLKMSVFDRYGWIEQWNVDRLNVNWSILFVQLSTPNSAPAPTPQYRASPLALCHHLRVCSEIMIPWVDQIVQNWTVDFGAWIPNVKKQPARPMVSRCMTYLVLDIRLWFNGSDKGTSTKAFSLVLGHGLQAYQVRHVLGPSGLIGFRFDVCQSGTSTCWKAKKVLCHSCTIDLMCCIAMFHWCFTSV